MARIYDNIGSSFTTGLRDIIGNLGVNRVDFCVGYFNLRGWDLVKEEVDCLEGDDVLEGDEYVKRTCRLLVGMYQTPEDLLDYMYSGDDFIPDSNFVIQCKKQIAEDFKRQLLIGLPTAKDEITLKTLSRQLKDKKVCIKLYLKEPLHAKLYLAYRPADRYNPILSIMGSSNLTYSGLTREGELNAEFSDSDSAVKLADWFEDRWNDHFCIDISDVLIDALDSSWASSKVIPPYYIYLKTAYHLSQDARDGINGYDLPIEFKGKLFDFQETAVKMIAKKLADDKKTGAMIGDVVGLGKTITACAIAKIHEIHYAARTLIICPANLTEMWDGYIRDYDLKADVRSIAQQFDVEESRYYKLVIIDESHNLRNDEGKRYRNIKALIEHLGCKVLLLTATPYNKNFKDIANQLRLFISEDQDLGIRPEEFINSIGGEMAFQLEYGDVSPRSIKAFEKSSSVEDWNELMKLFLVRRTRSFIKENYAKLDEANGRKYLLLNDGQRSYFPTRIPKAIKFKTTEGDQFNRMYSQDIIDIMESLILPRYGLNRYVDDLIKSTASISDSRILENLSRAGQQMMGFCKSTFFKRMDSCGYSYLLTIYRHILRNTVFLYAIENNLDFPISDENTFDDTFIEDQDSNNAEIPEDVTDILKISTDLDFYKKKAAQYYNSIKDKSNIDWLPSKFFKEQLYRDLEKDCQSLLRILSKCGNWNPDEDKKLSSLVSLLCEKHKDDKVIVFTQYSDTADYIYRQLLKKGLSHVGKVTGDCKNPTLMATRFSPCSNKSFNISESDQYRILIATDVLSEGQNLQDSHVIVNFDLPWAIIRLIQRAGRVDRIGQKAEEIFCYSFFPADGVETLINLRGRLNTRINENASVVGSDEVFFEGNEQNLRDMFNEKSGILDDTDDIDVDLSSKAYQIWKNATDANPSLKTIIPNLSNLIYSTKSYENTGIPYVENDTAITYAKTKNDFDVLTWSDINGKVITQSQNKILQALSCSIEEPAIEELDNHFDIVTKAIKAIENERSTTGGVLGTKTSVKYRIVSAIEGYIASKEAETDNQTKQTLLEVKKALDEIYNNPMLENSTYVLGRMLKSATIDEVIEVILEMRRDRNLCKETDFMRSIRKHASIICSMGLSLKEK